MSMFGRMKRVTTGKLEVFLSRAEKPEILFPQLIKEMEDQVRAATEAEAKAMAGLKSAEASLRQTAEKLDKMRAGAESALRLGDESTARDAVEAQLKLEAEVLRREASRDVAAEAYAAARSSREETRAQLEEVRSKKDELLTRARVVAAREKIERTVSGPVLSSGSILDSVAAIEAGIAEKESSLEVSRELAGGGTGAATASLERRIDALNEKAEIDRRFAALKDKVAGKGGAEPEKGA